MTVQTNMLESTKVNVTGGTTQRGPAGLAGPRLEFPVIAGFDISGHRIVVPRVILDTVRYADTMHSDHLQRPMWLTLNAALANDTLNVVAEGIVEEPSWNWSEGPIFLGHDGMLTQATPIYPDATFSIKVAYTVSPTKIYFHKMLGLALAL